jgi:hypothetical protein
MPLALISTSTVSPARAIGGGMPVKVGGLPTIGELHAEGQELLGQWLAFRQAVLEQGDELLLLAEGDIAQPQVQRVGKPRC